MTDNVDFVSKIKQAGRRVGFKNAAAKVDIRAELSARLGGLPDDIRE